MVSLHTLFSPSILLLLHPDICSIIEEEANCNIDEFTKYFLDGPMDTADDTAEDAVNDAIDYTADDAVLDEEEAETNDNEGTEPSDHALPADDYWSGFCSAHPKWMEKRFWNYVDNTLENLREEAKITGKTKEDQQCLYIEYVLSSLTSLC